MVRNKPAAELPIPRDGGREARGRRCTVHVCIQYSTCVYCSSITRNRMRGSAGSRSLHHSVGRRAGRAGVPQRGHSRPGGRHSGFSVGCWGSFLYGGRCRGSWQVSGLWLLTARWQVRQYTPYATGQEIFKSDGGARLVSEGGYCPMLFHSS
jgi:hypothetical protein